MDCVYISDYLSGRPWKVTEEALKSYLTLKSQFPILLNF